MTVVHGGLDPGELRSMGLQVEEVLDFSSNINPLGPSDQVVKATANASLSAYPDRHSLALREALSEQLGVDKECLLVGNGSTELIHLLSRALLQPTNRVLVLEPTFGEYRAAASLCGAQTVSALATATDNFRWSIDGVVRRVEQARPQMVFLCNPNNPTGLCLSQREVRRIHEATATTGLLVVDDAYMSLADQPWDTTPLLQDSNLVIIRSMTKDQAVAGLRLGYLVGDPDLVSAIRRFQPAWSVNALAQAAGLAAIGSKGHLDRARALIAESKEFLYRHLDDLGVPAVRSATNFVLARVGDAKAVRRALLRRRIVVRDCASFGLPDHIRIAVREIDECRHLVEALREVIQ